MEKATAVAAAGTGRERKPGTLTALDEAEKKEAPRGAFFVCCPEAVSHWRLAPSMKNSRRMIPD